MLHYRCPLCSDGIEETANGSREQPLPVDLVPAIPPAAKFVRFGRHHINPKRKRSNRLRPSLAIRVSVSRGRERYIVFIESTHRKVLLWLLIALRCQVITDPRLRPQFAW